MWQGGEEELAALLAGEAGAPPLVDFAAREQRAAAEAVGGSAPASAAPSWRPRLGDNLALVVATVALDPRGRVLMAQEAKASCCGLWYLPAGRVARAESLAAAAARETREETGLAAPPAALLAVESAAGCWFRFVFAAGPAEGGELKTPARADAESLQAAWVERLAELDLRAKDIEPLVERARAYRARPPDNSWHPAAMPVARPHDSNLLRLVAVIKRRSTNKVHVLLGEKTALHLPTVEIDPAKSLHSTLRKFLVDIFGADLPQHRPHGVLSVEHGPTDDEDDPTDGVCLTLLVAFRPPLEEAPIIGKYVWHEVSKSIGDRLLARIASKNGTIRLNVVR